ncbi:MAG: VWA domain-containing protein [Alphaproteobacteria bacterium]|nr:VWA domain-containing protein [Alphaproteobacteria bacterium]
MQSHLRIVSVCATVLFLWQWSLAPVAAASRPLQVEGVEGLDQRILTQPTARLRSRPESDGRGLPTFSHFYVFERTMIAGKEWLRVGPNRLREPTGWLPASETVPWKQAIALSFNQNTDRLPVVFFDRRDVLRTALEKPDRTAHFSELVLAARERRIDPASGVVALEPYPVADFASSFYLLPILHAEDVRIRGRRGGTKMIEVASVVEPLREPEPPRPFEAGIVFVIDTTTSMDKYIDRTRATVRRILDHIRGSAIGKRVSFGLVGFRDSTEGRPGLEYVTRVFHPLRSDFDGREFLRALDGMKAATVSSHGFEEDGLAGVMAALDMPGWREFDGRFVVMITDAPVRQGGDPRSSTALDPGTVAISATTADRFTAIFSLFLQTPEGKQHHDKAAMQMRQLSHNPVTGKQAYFPVPEGDVGSFGDSVDQLADAIVSLTRQVEGEAAATAPADDPVTEAVFEIGRAMQLAWLARHRSTLAPEIRSAWCADFDATADRPRMSFDVNVLLTRNQLNDLYQALDALAQTAAKRLDDPDGEQSFFALLREVLARAQTDPTTLQSLDPSFATSTPSAADIDSLEQLVAAWVDHLPYQSDLLGRRPEDLERLSPHELSQMLEGIQVKKEMYGNYFRDIDRWVRLNPEAGIEEAVYPVPLALMP